MVEFRVVIGQQEGAPVAAPAAPARPAASANEIGEQIRQSILDATAAARDAQQQQIREAQQAVRSAEQQVRNARTPDQKGAAEQALFGAQATLRDLQSSLGRTVHTAQPPMPIDMRHMIPPQAVDISIAFFVMCAVIIIGWPLARAFGRRLERRGQVTTLDAASIDQLQRIEQSVEAMAIEIERISESQRFMARLQSEAAERAPALPTMERR
jgi:multidrug efflux pump subunit AcrA (membrane-fusion protein)